MPPIHDAKDRRRTVLGLTAAGGALVDDTVPFASEIADGNMAPSRAAERETFLTLLKRLT
jgi:DNA-binding MarR family transcriptional regulator